MVDAKIGASWSIKGLDVKLIVPVSAQLINVHFLLPFPIENLSYAFGLVTDDVVD